ncbi:MAG: hypothetical protein ACRDZQ_15315, partial [Acidimicrobiales bacterium]
GLVLAAVALVAVAAVVLGWRRRQPLAVALGVLSSTGLGVSVLAASRIVGPISGYELTWATTISVTALLGLGVGLVGRRELPASPPVAPASPPVAPAAPPVAPASLLVGLAALGVSATLLFDVAALGGPGTLSDPSVATASRLVLSQLPSPPEPVLVDLGPQTPDDFALGAGIVDRLDGLGYRVRVPPTWRTQFGTSLAAGAGGDPTIAFTLVPVGSPPPKGATLLGVVIHGSPIAIWRSQPD